MNSIVRANGKDFQLLSEIGKTSYVESHGRSASAANIDMYVNEKYNYDSFKKELNDLRNIYHIIYQGDRPAGFSKIILNVPHSNIQIKDITKMERLYLLKEFYSLI